VISNNLPFEKVAQFFCELGPWLIIEFVPKSDSQVKKLFASRKDIFPNYTLAGFKEAFTQYYEVIEEESIKGSERSIFLLKHRP
jgi:hypothetical protein